MLTVSSPTSLYTPKSTIYHSKAMSSSHSAVGLTNSNQRSNSHRSSRNLLIVLLLQRQREFTKFVSTPVSFPATPKKRKPAQGPQSSSEKTNVCSQVGLPIQKAGAHTCFGAKAPNQVDPSALALLFSSGPLEWEDLRPQTGTDNPAHAKQTSQPRKTRLALGQGWGLQEWDRRIYSAT